MSSPLVALLLVTSSSRGSHVVFQWPRRPKLVKRYSRMRYFAEEEELEDDLLAAGATHPEYLDASDSESGDSDESDCASSEASFKQGAALFGHDDEERTPRDTAPPPHLGGRGGSEPRRSSARSRSTSRPPAGRTYRAGDEEKRLHSYTTYLGFDLAMLAAILSPKPEQCHHKFELVIDDLAFLGHPVYIDREQQQGRASESQSMTQFNLVMVIDRPDALPPLPGMNRTIWMHLYYTLLFKVTAVLYTEEMRASYVSEQTAALLTLRDECMQHGGWFRDYLQAGLAQSNLARTLREVQRAIARHRDTLVRVNEGVDLHMQLPLLLLQPGQASKVGELQRVLDAQDPVVQRGDGPEPRDALRTLSSLGALPGTAAEQTLQDWTRTTGPFLQPWKTLLLPEAPGESEQNDTIYDFAKPLIECFTPSLRGSRTFLQAADALQWDLYKEVYPMVRHLIYYTKGRVIDVPRIQSIYALDPTFAMDRLSTLEVSWSTSFPMMRALPQFLSSLSMGLRPYVSLFAPRINHSLCLDTLVWLLRHGVVVQMHVHLRLVITAQDQQLAVELRRARREHRARKPRTESDEEILIDTLRGQMQRGTNHPERPANARRLHRSRSRSASSDSSVDEFPAQHAAQSPFLPPGRRASYWEDETEMDMDDDDDRLDDLLPNGTASPVLVVEPSRASRRENEWISAMLHDKHAWYTRWLLRLLPYLNGKHTVDEIVARERIRRRDLKLIMRQFEANLLLFYHP